MVFFVCDCQETLKKGAVERHRLSCRSCVGLTCVDCNARFPAASYATHTTCISEAEKYEKALYRGVKAKRDPQAEWCAVIEAAAAAGGPHERHLSALVGYGNVPRKLKPFVAFAKNSLRIHNPTLLGEIFAAIQAHLPPKPAPQQACGGDSEVNLEKDVDGHQAPLAGAKRRRDDTGVPPVASERAMPSMTPFIAKDFIVGALASARKTKMKTSKLQAMAAAAATAAGEDAAVAESVFTAALARLIRKGKVVVKTSEDRDERVQLAS